MPTIITSQSSSPSSSIVSHDDCNYFRLTEYSHFAFLHSIQCEISNSYPNKS